MRNDNTINWSAAAGNELATRFGAVCAANGTSPEEVLASFIKDYIVSNGHPEPVVGGRPWNKQ